MATLFGTISGKSPSFPKDTVKEYWLGDEPSVLDLDKIGFVQFPGTDRTCMSEVLRVNEKINVERDAECVAKWCDGIRSVCSEVLSSKPSHWVPCEKQCSLSEFVEIYLRYSARKGPNTTITGWHRMLTLAGFPYPKDSVFSTKKKGLLMFLDDATGSYGIPQDKWACVRQHVLDVFSWMTQTAECGFPGHGMLMWVTPKNEPYSIKKLSEGKHRSIQFADLAVSIIEAYYTGWIYIDDSKKLTFLNLDDLMSLRPVASSQNWMLGGDVSKVIMMSSIFPPTAPLYSLDVSGWDRSLNFDVISAMMLSVVRNVAVAKCLVYGINGRGVYAIGDLLFKFRDLRAVLWASGNLKTLSGNCIIHAGLLRSIGAVGIVQGDDAVACFPTSLTEDKDRVLLSYARVGLEIKYVTPTVGVFEFTKRVFDINAKSVTMTGDVYKKACAHTLADSRNALIGIESMVKHNAAECEIHGWTFVVNSDPAVVAIRDSLL
jgi:hypothetical protein